MRKEKRKQFIGAVFMLAMFITWTVAARLVDVAAIGPKGSSVGFATLNRLVHNFTGVHMMLYDITDWLELIPLACMAGFAALGLTQWIKRKDLKKVDHDLIVLGGIYIAMIGIYVLFEIIVINFRPVLIEGILEASYPSSTTMFTLCVMPATLIQLNARIKNRVIRRCVSLIISLLTVFIVVGRLVSGVHWFSDIVGSVLVSAGLVLMYDSIREC